MKENPKITSLRASIKKIEKKIEELTERKKEQQKELKTLENMDIVGLVREQGLSLEDFAALMQQIRDNPIPPMKQTTEQEAEINE